MESLQGNFTSPKYPTAYPQNAYCRYEIIVPREKQILLTFEDIWTEQTHDYLTIKQLLNDSWQHVGTLSGRITNSTTFFSAENAFNITFRSDSEYAYRGFSAYYYTVDKGKLYSLFQLHIFTLQFSFPLAQRLDKLLTSDIFHHAFYFTFLFLQLKLLE